MSVFEIIVKIDLLLISEYEVNHEKVVKMHLLLISKYEFIQELKRDRITSFMDFMVSMFGEIRACLMVKCERAR